jgi:hypothetical protein
MRHKSLRAIRIVSPETEANYKNWTDSNPLEPIGLGRNRIVFGRVAAPFF